MLPSNSEYSIIRDGEVATLLSHFEHDFIYSVVTQSIQDKIRAYGMNMPNIIISYEQHFREILETYPDSRLMILETRENTYKEIIGILCNHYQIVFNDNDMHDIYSSTVYLYELLVSNFQSNLVDFFVNYIIKEKNTIYDVLNFNTLKRSKDSSTLYSKKIYKDTRLGIVCANLDAVIDNINVFDIDFHTYLNTVYGYERRNIAKHLELTITPINDFFKDYIVPCFMSNMRPILMTSIRLRLQELTSESDLNINNIVKEPIE